MGKGIKMRSAKDHRGHTYTVETLQRLKDAEGAAPPLLCDDPSCACSVRFVPRHQQNRSNRIESIDVPAYIRLSTGSEHAEGCRYDAAKRFTAIADQSDPEFLSALGDGKRELRLFALHNGLRKPGLSGDASVAAGNRPAAKAGSSSTDFAASERKLDSYLRTASDLVVLRAMCESDALLAAELTLRMGAKRIPWKQFFFEADRLDEAWEFIRRGGEAAHPIALAAAVRHHHSPGPGATYKSSFMNCFSLTRKTADPRRLETFEISVAHADATWLSSFPVGSEVAMFGFWKAADAVERVVPDKRDKSQSTTYVTHKLTLLPRFKKQLASVP
ncbi:hypothetical protein [Delftia acidovorans]